MAAVDVGFYCWADLYSGGQKVIDIVKASGTTTVIAWALHVAPETGDIVFNDPPTIVSGGRYVGDPGWPARLASLKQPPTSVRGLAFSIGGGDPVNDFHVLRELMSKYGAGPGSPLYENFGALKAAIPSIDAIDFDDEDLYDPKTTVMFALMLAKLGYSVTFCPYTNDEYWMACLQELQKRAPGLVKQMYLQCYDGGGGNTPGPWIEAVRKVMPAGFDARAFVRPGLPCRQGTDCSEGCCPADVASQLASWRSTGISGGWIWRLDDVLRCQGSGTCSSQMDPHSYASAIRSALG